MSLSLRDLRGPVRALFSDVDGTLTTNGRVEASTYAALEQLAAAGVPVVFVTGRPAGWGQAFMSVAGAAAVVTENGGVTWVRDGRRMSKLYGVPASSLPEWRRRMLEVVAEVSSKVPGARLSSDSKYREVDLAIDWNEEASLSKEAADEVVAIVRRAGFAASRSSVHVNFGPPHFDKLSACVTVVRHVLGGDGNDLAPYVFVGDALNDAPMFGGFPKSVGVANVRTWWDELAFKPTYVTERAEGAGLREVAEHLLRVRAGDAR
ncbi:MAG: HAD family phosphatase [Kofleriaceae bacterium]|nr:HAD family phosphatase [Kofleriaceae bacterium]MCL4227964.1 Cof-type HAD-IIB family hydrolase [Myxococcales bacterium]